MKKQKLLLMLHVDSGNSSSQTVPNKRDTQLGEEEDQRYTQSEDVIAEEELHGMKCRAPVREVCYCLSLVTALVLLNSLGTFSTGLCT